MYRIEETLKLLLLSLFLIGAGGSAQLAVLASFAIVILICLALSAFYSGSETALVSVNKMRINQRVDTGDAKAKIVHRLIESPDKMLALTLVGTNLANVLIAQFGERLTAGALPNLTESLQGLIATVGITTLLLIFGEILPKTIFRVKAESLALRYAYPLRLSELILAPIISLVQTASRLIVKLIDRGTSAPSPDAQREELRLLATMGERSGNLLTDQRRMIHSLLDLQHRTVAQVMVPLVDIVATEKSTTYEEFLQIAADAGCSRIPVYEEQSHNFVGIVHLLDVIYADSQPDTIEPFIRTDLHFVPESKNINALLKEIQESQHTMVFAVDEYGGIVGLATVEDLVEEIIGEFADERDGPDFIHRITPRILECDGRAEVDILIEHYGLPIPEGDYETVAGYILGRTGTIPKTGTELELEDAVITITDADARAIRKIRIRRRLGRFS